MKGKTFREKLEKQSLEYANTHDMLVEASDGQIYLKEKLHRVNTNQVTGEALKKVSVGGKGGMGSQGDARDQDKQVDVSARVMVMSDPSQMAFNHNVALEQVVIGWEGEGIYAKPVYLEKGKSVVQKRFVPSHIFGEKEIKGWIETTKSLGREYNDFAYSNQHDPSDLMKRIESMYATQSFIGDESISEEMIMRLRADYDALCGYKGAWKYVGHNGAKQRRYRFTIINKVNLNDAVETRTYNGESSYMNWEASSYNHNTTVYALMTQFYNESRSNEWLDEQMKKLERKDCAQYIMWQLGEPKPWDWREEKIVDDKTITKPSEDFLRERDAMESLHRKKQLEAMSKGPGLDDWRMVYNWELTKQGKTLFAKK